MTIKKREKDARAATSPLIEFTAAAHEHTELAFDITVTPTAVAQSLGPFDVPAYGFLRHVFIEVVGSGGTGGTAQADAPWNLIQSIQLNDTNGAPIVGPFDGFSLFTANKYGGYSFRPDPASNPGAIVTTPNFAFGLRLPVEVNHNNGFGAVPNQNAAAPYRVAITLNTLANVWSVNPAPVPAFRIRGWLEAWSQPTAQDLLGRPQAVVPPRVGTSQYWSLTPVTVVIGQNNLLVRRVGNHLRTMIFIARDGTGARSNVVLPDPVELRWDARTINFESLFYRRNIMQERIIPNANAVDTGVLVWSYSHDLKNNSGDGTPELYLPTSQATRLELIGSNFGAAGSVSMLINDVAPVEVNPTMRFAERNASGFTPQLGGIPMGS